MDIWHYDGLTGALLGPGVADPNPHKAGEFLIPAYATQIRPPFVPPGCIAIFDGVLVAKGSWRVELRAIDDLRQRLAPQLTHLANEVDAYCRNAGSDQATAMSLVLEAAEATIMRATDSEELRAEVLALLQDVLGPRCAN